MVCNLGNRLSSCSLYSGYKTFFPESTDYWLEGAPRSWAKIPAMRHAMAKFPHSTYFWFLDQNSLIMNPDLTIEAHVMDHKRMDTIMLRDQSIVPPDSVIKTFPQLRGEHIDLAITQDQDGLSTGSFIIRRGDWAKFFLDTWLDPLYRSYNFQKAETHALVGALLLNLTWLTVSGTHRSMASNHTIQTCHHPPTTDKCIQQRRRRINSV